MMQPEINMEIILKEMHTWEALPGVQLFINVGQHHIKRRVMLQIIVIDFVWMGFGIIIL